jgi:hypothetical protein
MLNVELVAVPVPGPLSLPPPIIIEGGIGYDDDYGRPGLIGGILEGVGNLVGNILG